MTNTNSKPDNLFTEKGSFLAKYAPTGDDAYLIPAWLGCLRWAMTDKEVAARFTKDTGIEWNPGKTAIDRMIDDACGMQERYFEAFAKWMNENIWGEV